MRRLLAVFILCQSLLGPPVQAQIDGSFWWMNTDLVQKAEQYRQEKDVKANVVNNETEIDSIRLAGNTYTDDSDDSPDCICVPSHLCRTTLTGEQGRDGLCGSGQTCCRKHQIISQHHPHASTNRPPIPQKPLIPSSLHAPDTPGSSDQSFNQPGTPNLSFLLEISSLLQEFNSHDNSFEPDAELIFHVTPRSPTTVLPTTTPPTTAFKPIVFSDSTPRPTPTTARTTRSTTTATTTTTRRPLLPPKPKKCGQRRATITSRVHFLDEDESIEEQLSGSVNFGEFPWTVYLEERINNGSFLYKCGGALVTSNAIVTAGHCIANARDHPENFQVIAGDWDRRHNRERLPSQRRTVNRIILHPDYYSGSLYNDIAVLILNTPLNDSLPNVGNVCLPSPGSDFSDSNCILSSWGASPSKPTEEATIQRFVTMPIVPGADCEERLRTNSSLGRRFRMHDSFLCAGGIFGVDSCKGSGGSPLVCQRNGAYMLAGIMSWGVSCGKGDPAVFTNVVYHSSWVDRVIDSLDDNVVYFV
ncbi:inactive CLIP domain-containing serine protease A28-like [Ochlerotatus camptorhynchus]|uniref:inactive CLIP domain-containing serine protease A28-like n=1 Tax=Ochlerotatus camptorhynchus TaxID=644619 RepID=UPI0031E31E9E